MVRSFPGSSHTFPDSVFPNLVPSDLVIRGQVRAKASPPALRRIKFCAGNNIPPLIGSTHLQFAIKIIIQDEENQYPEQADMRTL